MKRHLSGLVVAILTFVIGWSIPVRVLNPHSDEILVFRMSGLSARPWALLLAYENQDLTKLDPHAKARLQLAVDSLRGPTDNESLYPRLFSRITTSAGEQRYVLVEESSLRMIPGESRLRTSVFTTDGTLLSSSEFGAGWRIAISGVSFIEVGSVKGEVLQVESFPMINGADIAKQYYSLVADEMRLIRLEDSRGVLIPNVYRTPNYTIGFTHIGQSAEDWEKALTSGDTAEVLAALTWLAGKHLDPGEGVPDYSHEYISEAQLVQVVRTRPVIAVAVSSLKDSNNPWVREAATAADLTLMPLW